MTRKQFLYWAASIVLFFVFASIYQYNRVVRLQYDIQKIEKEKIKLAKLFDQHRAQLCALKDARLVKSEAQAMLGFSQLKLSQIITLTTSLS